MEGECPFLDVWGFGSGETVLISGGEGGGVAFINSWRGDISEQRVYIQL